MSEMITYGLTQIGEYAGTLGNTAALLGECHNDLRNLAAALSEGHLGKHSDAWQAQLAQVNQALDHFSQVVMQFGSTHSTVAENAANTDSMLAGGIHGA
jgi:uncharacterized protein YukE